MGQSLSQCGSVSDCMDMNPVMMMKAKEEGPAVESPPAAQPVLASTLGGTRGLREGEGYFDPAHGRMKYSGIRTDDKLFDRTPRSQQRSSRSHATERSFGDRTPAQKDELLTPAGDRVLEDLRDRYSVNGVPNSTDPAQIAAMIAREREYLMDAGEQPAQEEPETDTALVRSAMHVVAERYVTEGINALMYSPSAAKPADASAYQQSIPKTQFSQRRKEEGEGDRGGGKNLSGRFDQVMTPRSGHSTLRSTDGSGYSDDSGDHEHEQFDLGDASDFVALNVSTKIGETSVGEAKKSPGTGQPLTIAEVLPRSFGITLQEMERLGTPPPPQMLELKMSEEEWTRHFVKSGMDNFINRLASELNPSAPSQGTRPTAPGPGRRATGPGTEQQSILPKDLGAGPEAATTTRPSRQFNTIEQKDPDPKNNNQTEPATRKPTEDELPSGWKSYVSRTTGRMFYKNKVTNVTTWQRPTEPAQWASNQEQEHKSTRNEMSSQKTTPAATPRQEISTPRTSDTKGKDALRPPISGRGKIMAATEQWVQDMQGMTEAGLTPKKSPRTGKDSLPADNRPVHKVHADFTLQPMASRV